MDINVGDSKFYWWIGKVIENDTDPSKIGRVKIRIYNQQDTVNQQDLLYAYPMMGCDSASSNGVGDSPTGIINGSVGFGFFLDGKEKNIPVLIGTYYANGDMMQIATGTDNVTKKGTVGPEPKSSYAAVYPYNRVTVTRSGHVIEYDDTPNSSRIRVYHKSGSYFEISDDGQWVSKSIANNFEISCDDKNLYIQGDWNVKVQQNANLTIQDNLFANVGGVVNATAEQFILNGDVYINGNLFVSGFITAD